MASRMWMIFEIKHDKTSTYIRFIGLGNLLRREVHEYFQSLGLDIWDAWTFFRLLDADGGGEAGCADGGDVFAILVWLWYREFKDKNQKQLGKRTASSNHCLDGLYFWKIRDVCALFFFPHDFRWKWKNFWWVACACGVQLQPLIWAKWSETRTGWSRP